MENAVYTKATATNNKISTISITMVLILLDCDLNKGNDFFIYSFDRILFSIGL